MSCLGGKPLAWLSPYIGVAATANGNSAVTDGHRLVGFGATGDVLWERESWPIEFLGASSDAVVIYDAGQTMALDPSTGVEVWSSSGAPHIVTNHLLLQCPAGHSALALINAETWDELWSANEPCDLAVIDGESVTIVADGATSEDRSQVLLFETASGELSVRRVLEDGIGPETVTVSGGALWALHPRDGTISRLDPNTGEAMWESPIGITHPFAVASTEAVTIVATPLAVIALDTATGEQLWWAYLPFQWPEPG